MGKPASHLDGCWSLQASRIIQRIKVTTQTMEQGIYWRNLTLHKLGEAGDGNRVLGDQRRSSEWSRQAGCHWLGIQ